MTSGVCGHKNIKEGLVLPSISFRKSSTKTNIKHNNRERIPANADPKKTPDNIIFCKKDIAEVYKNIFSAAIDKYNDGQKRADRKIDDYYRKTLHDKKTKEQQELIVQIGETGELPFDICKEILQLYIQGFEERNKNLALYNAVMHLDEATPHLHINFVPFADYEKGLSRRVNFEKALEQQGMIDFNQWREQETGIIEKFMNERGLERTLVGTHDKYLSPNEYKNAMKEVENLKQNIIEKIEPIYNDINLKCKPINPQRNFTGHYTITAEEVKTIEELQNTNIVLNSEVGLLKANVIKLQEYLNESEERESKSFWKKAYDSLKTEFEKFKGTFSKLEKEYHNLKHNVESAKQETEDIKNKVNNVLKELPPEHRKPFIDAWQRNEQYQKHNKSHGLER